MDTSPQAGSNNVTVEYTDPSGLFPSVQPIIESKLPLKNLHWKSPTRPVRSIESLRIGFVPGQHDVAERKSSSDTIAGAVTHHRRHQIPGLRQTPYLKIYLLRCDDNETYKASARKAVREWIKTHAAAAPQSTTSTSSQEKHDAFEWLILHVVQDGSGADKAVPSSKWGRGTTTVLEKVKADFNGSSKSAVDRVAQLRLPKPGTNQKPPELADQVEDLVEKIKNAILASFDLRVAQYEEDIKEKDSQRSLPGWNFCTFFILKEGLARGFENVGLYDDALVGYDELSVGLDTAINEQLEGTNDQHGGAFLTCSKDWREKAQAVLNSQSADAEDAPKSGDEVLTPIPEIDAQDFPLDSNKKPYREMILASDISIFHFRTYVFSRQLTLLLRAARAPSLINSEMGSAQTTPKKDKKPEDLMLLSEICERATEFISLAARTLRYDLEIGLTNVDNPAKPEIINNLVSAWTYAAALQILSQTFTPNLSLPESSLHAVGKTADGAGPAAAIAETRPDVPRRSSSLVAAPPNRPNRPNSQDIFSPDSIIPIHTRSGTEPLVPTSTITQKTGSEQLASGRGELLLQSRRVLEEIASVCGWKEKWNDLGLLFDDKNSGERDMADVSLDDEGQAPAPEPKTVPSIRGIDLPGLKAALSSRKAFLSQYAELTDQIFRHHITANRTFSAEMAVADIAILRFRQADYSAAASFFHHIAPFYGSKNWVVLEGIMLEMYARCLKELKRSEEYVRMVLRLLAKFAAYSQANLSGRQKTLDASSVFTEKSPVSQYVDELFEASGALQKEISAPLADFFGDLRVNPAIRHYEDKDGFQIQLSLRFLLGEKIDVESIKARLVNASGTQSNEHWIDAPTKAMIRSSPTKIMIDSSMVLEGKYFVDRLELRAGNIVFTLIGGKNSAFPLGFREVVDAEEEDSRPYIYCHPPPDGLRAKIVSPHLVNLEGMRTLELELHSGWNDIQTGTIRVRPATAGLRLRIAEAEVVEGEINIVANNESGTIEFTKFGAQSFVRFRIPYTVEEPHAMLTARAEVGYETTHGRFSYSSVHSISSALPISVNVQDIFKDEVLFSRFTISPAMLTPLRILGCNIPSSEVYEVQSSIRDTVAMDVFPKQPASLLYKIRQREDSVSTPRSKRSLRLSVEFTCVDDECLNAVEKTFKAAIEASVYRPYSSLLTSHVVEAFRTQLSHSDMEVIGLTREIETLAYQSIRWENLLSALKEPEEGLRAWLGEWHK
ncbi:hypothetical protein MW887_008258, partial [Aspergillus wentii]